MKFSKLSQLFLVSAIGLVVASLLTSCEIVTVDYLFVASSSGSGTASTGQIGTYDVDSGSGAIRPGQPSVPLALSNPVALAVSTDYKYLYAASAGSGSSGGSINSFSVGSNGVLKQVGEASGSPSVVGTPVSLAVNPAGTFLYVVSGPSRSGTLTVYALSSGNFGNPVAQIPLVVPGFAGDSIAATGVNVLANGDGVYVTAYDLSAYNPGCTPVATCITSTANPGWVFGFDASSGGALTPVAGSPWKAGIKPSAIASDPTNRFVYVTDFASNELIGYTVQSSSVLNFMVNGPFKTGNEPSAITIDPRGLYIYVSNALDSTVSAYVIALATGTPSAAVNTTGSSINSTDTQPVAILVDPALGRFVYTANHLGNSVSGFKLNATTGTITATLSTPYPTGDTPTALASVPHGNHAIQSTAP